MIEPKRMKYILAAVMVVFGLADSLHAQEPADSSITPTVINSDSASGADTLATDSVRIAIPAADSLMNALKKSRGPLSGALEYSGETLVFYPDREIVVIRRQATVVSAGQTVNADSVIAYNRKSGEIYVSGNPALEDDSENLTGSTMRYNIDSDRGLIEGGRTKFVTWTLYSDSLSKVGSDSIFGKGNIFFSCDRDVDPFYSFESERIKVIRDKSVFASPVIFKVGKVPVFALPFVFFPITPGNRGSGILQPRFGVNSVVRESRTGRTISNLGYFWAPNDYFDVLGAVDIRTASQTTLRARTRYKKRYSFDGSFDARLIDDKLNNSTAYSLFGRHNQTIGEKSRLVADVNYTSTRSLLSNTSFDKEDVLRQSIRSTASYSWRPSWGSLNTSLRHEMFLQDEKDRTQLTLPSISFSFNRRNLFNPRTHSVPRNAGLITPGWLYNLTYGFSSSYTHRQNRSEGEDTQDLHTSNSNFSLDSPQTLYGWLKLNPGLTYGVEMTHDNQNVDGDSFVMEQTMNFSTSLSTQIFGIFDGPRIGPIFRWRHSIKPKLTYTYQPDLREDSDGGALVNRASFSLTNDIDYKYSVSNKKDTKRPAPQDTCDCERDSLELLEGELQNKPAEKEKDSKPQEKNGTLLSLRNSLNYDFIQAAKRDTLGWSDLSTNLTSSPANFFNLQLSMNHQLVEPGAREVFKPFMNRISTTLTLRGTYKGDSDVSRDMAELQEEAYMESMRYPTTVGSSMSPYRSYDNQRDLAYARSMPWSLNLSHNLNRYRNGADASQSLRWSLTFNPTRNWHLVYSSSFNFSESGLQSQTFMINREIRCWQANVSLITLPGGRFEFTFSTFLRSQPAIRVPDVRSASN